MVYKNSLLYGLICFAPLSLFCTGEIFSSWEIEWDLASNSSIVYSNIVHYFSINSDIRTSFYDGNIDANGKLTESLNIYGYNNSGVQELKPSFALLLKRDLTVLLDTVFSWDEMQFIGHTSKKVLPIP